MMKNQDNSKMNYLRTKRIIDYIVSTILFYSLSPFILMIGSIIKVTSPGPIFYRWKVAGKDGRYFTGYKLRSMYINADKIKQELVSKNEMSGPVFKMTDDPRVTPIGRFLRKYSIDEIPQLWSVINGDMALVGPRPPLQSEYEQFNDWQKKKLAVKPGITCIWQISGRNDIKDFDEWVRLDLKYIEKRNFQLDMMVLLNTLKCALKGTGK